MQIAANITKYRDMLIIVALLVLAGAVSLLGNDIMFLERLDDLNGLLSLAAQKLMDAIKEILAIYA